MSPGQQKNNFGGNRLLSNQMTTKYYNDFITTIAFYEINLLSNLFENDFDLDSRITTFIQYTAVVLNRCAVKVLEIMKRVSHIKINLNPFRKK